MAGLAPADPGDRGAHRHILCATPNDFYNALVCKVRGARFGRHRALQLATHQESDGEAKRMTLQQRGYLEERLDGTGEAWVLLGGVAPDGGLLLHSVEQPIEPEAGWRVLTFAPAD